jgi:hypothetical protein
VQHKNGSAARAKPLNLLATPTGFEPVTLSLEGCQITLIDKHIFSKWTLNRRLSINRLPPISQTETDKIGCDVTSKNYELKSQKRNRAARLNRR